jgi:ABC-2 type transport system permease protein
VAVADPAPGRQPRSTDFVRLKLRLLGNSLRSQPMRAVGFALGVVFGLCIAGPALVGLSATAAAPDEIGYLVAVCTGSAVVLGWMLVPLLFFGIDETLDPARFALLPIAPATLIRGMLAAAFIGVPAPATLIATTGLGVAAWLRFGVVPGVVALLGVGAGLTIGIVASRALTSAFAALLRSRRARDLAAVIIALLASSIGPLQWLITAGATRGSVAGAVRVAEVLAWTPLGAAYALPYDVAGGRWDLAAARAAIVAATIALLLRWWSRTLESAMLATSSGGAVRGRPAAGGAVRQLLPPWLRARPGPFSAIVAREVRFWWRDGRRRPALVSIVVASAVLPIALSFAGAGRSPVPDVAGGVLAVGGFSFAVTMSGTMTGMLLCNQFGFDGTAFVSHLLTRVSGALELRARAAAIALIIVPVQILVVVAVCLVTGAVAYLPVGLGVLAASVGAGLASAALLSVLAPYSLPESQNPFATSTGSGSMKGLFAFVALLATLVLSLPMTLAAILIPAPVWGWVLLAVGLAYGLGAVRLGTWLAGDLLERRGPEILVAVTPRR